MRKYLVALRDKYGFSQQDVANKLGISRQYYQMIESGERQKCLALPLASSLATLYNLSVMDIEHYEAAEGLRSCKCDLAIQSTTKQVQ